MKCSVVPEEPTVLKNWLGAKRGRLSTLRNRKLPHNRPFTLLSYPYPRVREKTEGREISTRRGR